MKCGTRDGLHIKYKKDEKEFVSEEEKEMFWKQGLLGTCTAKSVLNTVYFYNGKLFGLRGGEHRNIVVNNFEIGSNFLTFTENASKTFHGGLRDLKYVPRVVKHVCHERRAKHDRCLLDIYRLYIGLVETIGKQFTAFYFRPSAKRFAYEKSPVGINYLNKILPDMCKTVGVKRKTAHCLRVTCASSLFNAGVEEKLIRQRTGHRSNSLFNYEKPSEENVAKISGLLGPTTNYATKKDEEIARSSSSTSTASNSNIVIEGGEFSNCSFYLAAPNE